MMFPVLNLVSARLKPWTLPHTLMRSYLVDVDEKTIRLQLWVNDSSSGTLLFQKLLEVLPLVLKIRSDHGFIQLSDKSRQVQFICTV